jgi:hypothetical protein
MIIGTEMEALEDEKLNTWALIIPAGFHFLLRRYR